MKQLLLVLGLAVAVSSCGSSSPSSAPSTPTAPPAPTAAVFTVTGAPTTIIAGNGTSGFQFSAQFTISVQESAGVGGNIAFINVTMRNLTTGIEVGTIQFNPGDIQNRAATNHIAARGKLDVPLGVNYTLAGSGRQAVLTVAIQLLDDLGNRTNQTVTLNVV